MIKIMIVDDMPVYREYLRNFIDWNAYGFEVCCEAKDGREALLLYTKYQPDIVLTDIMMPYMDGLTLSEKLYEENPEVSIILITGNSEFEYARKAVKLGVCDYIVKPFEKEELIISLLKLHDNMNRVLELDDEKDELLGDRKQQILRNYIRNDESAKIPEQYNLFPYPYFLVVTVRIDLYENKVESEEILNWKQIIRSMISNMIQINGKHEVFHDYEGNIVTILNFRDRQSMEDYSGYEFEDISTLAKEHIGFATLVGISGYAYDISHIKEAYYQTLQALSNSFAEHHLWIFDYKKKNMDNRKEFYSWNLIEEINKSLEVYNYERIEKLITEELERIKEYENAEFAVMIYMSLLSLLFSYFVKIGRNVDDIFGKGFHPYSIITSETSYEEKRQFICECYHTAIEYQTRHKNSKAHQIAGQAKNYIEKNYMNLELSIADLSKELLVNQTYLRKMFKDEYQTTLSDYITKVRMEKAKEMIVSENFKLSYISERVGYNDTSYFSKCFKKYYGYSPSDIIFKQ
ncbi:MAG: response regulator [Mobilitalea sp.]